MSRLRRILSRGMLSRKLGRRGIAAVEFALIMPFLLVLFIGTIQVATLYRTQMKLNALAFNIAQMVSLSQEAASDSSNANLVSLNDICQGAVLGMAPFQAGGMTVDIASITEEASSAGEPQTSTGYKATSPPNYDEWESDSTVAPNGTCATPADSADAILTSSVVSTVTTGTSAMLDVPCDNVVVVKLSAIYSGIMGLGLGTRPILAQTAFARWANETTKTELLCPDCTLYPPSQATQYICNSTNTSTN